MRAEGWALSNCVSYRVIESYGDRHCKHESPSTLTEQANDPHLAALLFLQFSKVAYMTAKHTVFKQHSGILVTRFCLILMARVLCFVWAPSSQ